MDVPVPVSMENNDVRLVGGALSGDRSAFDLLVRRHSPQVFRLALRMLGSREEAEDVEQETFVDAYRGLSRFRADASFGTWVCSIAAKKCLGRRRQWARRKHGSIDEADYRLAGPGCDPADHVLERDSARRVQQALAKLRPPDRLLIVLRFIEGLSHDEISHVLGCSVESSRSRLLRAKTIFRKAYESVE